MAEMANVVGGEIIPDEWGNQIRSRTIQRYATVAARTAAHPSPTAGDLSYLQDSGDLDVYHGGVWRHIGPPVGAVQMLAGGSVPGGWLVCNGSPVSRTTYAALFLALGTTWGAGDGTTTFNLPDLRGRVPRGVAASGAGDGLGETLGADSHNHVGEAHGHGVSITTGGAIAGVTDPPGAQFDGTPTAGSAVHHHVQNTNTVGTSVYGTSAEANIPAAAAIHFIVKT